MSKIIEKLLQKSGGGTLDKSINLRVSENDKEALKFNASLTGKSMSELIYLACLDSGLFVAYKSDSTDDKKSSENVTAK